MQVPVRVRDGDSIPALVSEPGCISRLQIHPLLDPIELKLAISRLVKKKKIEKCANWTESVSYSNSEPVRSNTSFYLVKLVEN